jgi:uncharacterized phage-associated protein
MATVHDVAAFIVKKCGRLSAMKLQKLVYYAQAWSLVWDDMPAFNERIEAWVSGPVVPDLYELHKGKFYVENWQEGDAEALAEDTKETIGIVCDYYGKFNAQQLSDLTHSEDPWRIARRGLHPLDRGNRVISLESMSEYYSSIQDDE